jgi:hypothetical protein
MEVKLLILETQQITDWDSFHSTFKEVFGFPNFYGANMDAWIDCLTDLDVETGMTEVTVATGGQIILKINDAGDFYRRCPEQYEALLECTAFVNYRRVEVGDLPILALMPIGFFRKADQLTKPVEIGEIIDHVANRPARDARSADEIIGYDENGLPS